MMIGWLRSILRISSQIAYPSMPGNMMSRRIRSKVPLNAFLKPDSPSATAATP
jgi:hypothetical protein